MASSSSLLDPYRNVELTLEDLVAASARLLRNLDVRPGDGRVAWVPDARGVRYYQGIGVVDRPQRYEGRRAIYGFRHLLQLLAVKQLQQEGHPLHLIQQSLAGCPTPVLEQAIGALLSGPGRAAEAREVHAPPPADSGATQAAGRATGSRAPERVPAPAASRAPEPVAGPASLIATRIAPGVTITLDPALVSDPDALIARVTGALTHSTPAPARPADAKKEQ